MPRQQPVPGSVCDELPDNPKQQIQIDTETITSTGKNCTLILRIGKSEFVEIKGKIRPACLPSSHK